MFKHLIAQITKPENLELGTLAKIEQLRSLFPAVPEDYFVFLLEVGWGDIGGMMMYSGLVNALERFQLADHTATKIMLFGDDWQGYGFGFDLGDDAQLVEVGPDGEVNAVPKKFRDFIPTYMS